MKKITVIGVVFLFIGISIAPSIGGSIGELNFASLIEEVSDISSKLKKTNENDIAIYDESAVFGTRLFDAGNSFGGTIYVDDDNTEGPWDGTQDHPYQHIQDAIDNASDGDTIFVFNGSYSRIVVNKPLDIFGESRDNTKIIAVESRLDGNNINIAHFTFEGKVPSGLDNVLYVTGNYITVSDCTCYPASIQNGPLYGIELRYCSYVRISNCEVRDFFYRGIYIICLSGPDVKKAHHVYIENCSVSGAGKGIHRMGDHGNEYYIYNCEIFNCRDSGIFIDCGNDQTKVNVYNCDIHDNPYGVVTAGARGNHIIGCNIHDNEYGVYLWDPWYGGNYARENLIISNDFHKNSAEDIYIDNTGYDNFIYYNNFFYSSQTSVFETDRNYWDDGYYGNFWFDYDGEDVDGDGIGDSPYIIPGGYSQDNYPFIHPVSRENKQPDTPSLEGENSTFQWVTTNYYALSIDPDSEGVQYLFDWDDGSTSGWIGPYALGISGSSSHEYEYSGNYNIKVKARDVHGKESEWSYPLVVNVLQNYRPEKPEFYGPSEGVVDYLLDFSAVSTDDDGDRIKYYFDWGDGNSKWTRFIEPGVIATISSSWGERMQNPGNKTYTVRVKAQDIRDADSEWSSLILTITNTCPSPTVIIEAPPFGSIWKPYCFTVKLEDPDNHKLGYEVEWGDGVECFRGLWVDSGSIVDVCSEGPYSFYGEYTIRIRTMDYWGARGPWTNTTVTISRIKNIREILNSLNYLESFMDSSRISKSIIRFPEHLIVKNIL